MNNKIYQMTTFITVFAVIVGCTTAAFWKSAVTPPVTITPDLQNDVSLQRECAELFKTILEIQDSREQFRMQFDVVQEAFSNDQVGQPKITIARRVWLRNENALAGEVATLYSSGREDGCFQRVTQ
jgi:hypothetical protein